MECRKYDSDYETIIINATLQFIDEKNVSRDEFIMGDLIPSLERAGLVDSDSVTDGESYERWKRAKCKQIERMMKGATPVPAKFITHWVAALPQPYRTSCQHKLAAVLGTVFTPIISTGPRSQPYQSVKSHLDKISLEFADVLQNAKPALDGIYDETDSPADLQHLADELYELHAAVLAEMGRIKKASGIQPIGHTLMQVSPLFSSPEE